MHTLPLPPPSSITHICGNMDLSGRCDKNTGNTRLPLWVTDAMLGALFPVSSHTLPLADDDVDMYYVSLDVYVMGEQNNLCYP